MFQFPLRTALVAAATLLSLHAGPSAIAAARDNPTNQTRAVVVDLDAVAKAIRHTEVMDRQIASAREQIEQQLLQKLQEIGANYQRQIDEEKAKAGDDATEEQNANLQAMTAQANRNLEVLKQRAQTTALQGMQEVRQRIVANFQARVRPIVQEVALRNNANLVLTPSGPLIWFDASADITGEVIDAVRSRGGLPALAGQPATAPSDAPPAEDLPAAEGDPAPKG